VLVLDRVCDDVGVGVEVLLCVVGVFVAVSDFDRVCVLLGDFERVSVLLSDWERVSVLL